MTKMDPRRESSDPSVAALLGIPLVREDAGRAYAAYPSLRRVRFLLPTDDPVVRRAGLEGLFRPGSMKGRLLGKMISTGGLRGERVWLEEDALARLETRFSRPLGEQESRVAFYVGTPGAYQKVTAQVLTPAGSTLAYAKIASSHLAQEDVEAERRTLVRLSESEYLSDKVPEVLGSFGWQGGKTLLMTGGPRRLGPKRLSRAHLEFCGRMFLSFAREEVFGESPMWTRMVQTSQRLEGSLPDPLSARFDGALGVLRDELGAVTMPLSLAHRDFTPWNTRSKPPGLFVFDWDRAEEGTVPLYDVFHFQAIQIALSRRRRQRLDLRFLRDSLDVMWPEGRDRLPWLYLAYLVDVGLFYSEAQVLAPGVGEQRVWRWFVDQIQAFLERGTLP